MSMLRPLKHHEKPFLKKTDYLVWKKSLNVREIKVIRRYHLQDREDYTRYNRLVGQITKLVAELRGYDPSDNYRIEMTKKLLQKLYDMGLITTKASLVSCEKVNVSAFCRRRLPVVMFRLKFTQSIKQAVTYIEQGHIRVGPDVITDPAFLVTRAMEDFVTWVTGSKIRRTIAKYNNQLDDYELMQE